MRAKPVRLRALAARDLAAAIEAYAEAGEKPIADGFVAAVERAVQQLGRFPESGSTHYESRLGIPGLRFWPLRGFPHLTFYVEREDFVDVWRVLHARRDIPSSFQD